ncbi:MAG: nitrate reductase [Deltaproteobacteria bacterium]|nr:MAG: nitrate reductase [Deltaproteobacteria bacterium]
MSTSIKDRLPPNQVLTAKGKWPLVGERVPRNDDGPWLLHAQGLVERPCTWSLDELKQRYPWQQRTLDIHCVTRWSMLDASFAGIALLDVLKDLSISPQARFVSFIARSERSHSTSLPLSDLEELDPLLAFEFDGQPLTQEHGGPLRVVVAGRYFYKSLKWLETLLFLENDNLGYWEGESGYHNHADPWKEERYIVSGLQRSEVRRLLQSKNLSGQTLLSLEAQSMRLPNLVAENALLRNANFQHANLAQANFKKANLSNAHFQGACLQDATLQGADVEGANFCGADLRGCNFEGASLFGATFAPEPGDPSTVHPAILDSHTRIPSESWEALSDAQREFLRKNVGEES